MARTLTQLNHLVRACDARLALIEAKGGDLIERAPVEKKKADLLEEIAAITNASPRLPYADDE